MSVRLRNLGLIVWLGSQACGGSEVASNSGESAPTPEETSTREEGTRTQTLVQQSLIAADSVFDFDPTIDPAATPSANASAIAAFAKQNVAGCGSVQATGTTVTIAFGAAPGCTLTSGVQIAGTLQVAVSKNGAETTVTLTFDQLAINGQSVTGSVTMVTSDGSTFQTSLDLTDAGKAIRGTLTVKGATASVTLNGTVESTQTGATTAVVFTNVTYSWGSCYPNGGSMQITRGGVTETITFSSATATTGTVTVTLGKRTTSAQLPAYGSCPGSGWGAGGKGGAAGTGGGGGMGGRNNNGSGGRGVGFGGTGGRQSAAGGNNNGASGGGSVLTGG